LSEPPPEAEDFVHRLELFAEEFVVLARRMLYRPDEAEDALQSAIAAAWSHRGRFAAGTDFRAWIYRFLVHEVRNVNRRTARRPRSGASLPDESIGPEFWEALDAERGFRELLDDPPRLVESLDRDLAGALERLESEERLALLLKAVGEFSCAEIAKITRAPTGTVMARLFRARAKLRRSLGASFQETETPPPAGGPRLEAARRSTGRTKKRDDA